MIPRTIHYCWFGGNSLPEYAKKCIDSWKKYFPGYKIKEWNESNYDISKIPYMLEAYNVKKYAFVSDYARFDMLHEFGGIYFDVDVEVIRPFGEILDDTGFMGTEVSGGIAAGLGVGCNAGLGVVRDILESYKGEHFLCEDGITYNLKTIVQRVTRIFREHGFNERANQIQRIADFTIYTPEYFAPLDSFTGRLNITRNSVSIHYYDGSWLKDGELEFKKKVHKLYKILGTNIISKILVSIIYFVKHIFEDGFISTIKRYLKIIRGKRNV